MGPPVSGNAPAGAVGQSPDGSFFLKFRQHLRGQRETDFNEAIRQSTKARGVNWREGGVRGGVSALLQQAHKSGNEMDAAEYKPSLSLIPPLARA